MHVMSIRFHYDHSKKKVMRVGNEYLLSIVKRNLLLCSNAFDQSDIQELQLQQMNSSGQ